MKYFLGIISFVCFYGIGYAQTNEEKLKHLQEQLDVIQIQNGDEDDVDARKINKNIEELEEILKKRDSLNFQISILKTELLLAQAKLKTCQGGASVSSADCDKITEKNSIYFDFNSIIINSTQIEKLNNLLKYFLTLENGKKILVVGHTDASGNHAYNLSLSKKRSIAVKNYFVSKGINPNIFLIDYRGENDLLFKDSTLDNSNLKFNRRVTVIVI